ncbi:MAG: HEAT repeat domain-containing protein [Gammaproteobacteria bacterium]|nr:HEAT repeat domain-containing protein [Gammaproteobacteria bacterium]
MRDYKIRSRADVKAIVQALVDVPNESTELAALLEQVDKNSPAHAELRQIGVQELVRVFDGHLDRGVGDARYMMDVLRVLAMYGGSEGAQRIVGAAGTPSLAAVGRGGYWYAVLRSLPDGADREFVFETLADPLSAGPVVDALLEAGNMLALAGGLRKHPFDSVEGCDQLRRWLAADDPDNRLNATVALAFMESPLRDDLLGTAMEHADPYVRIEAAWVSARAGDPGGLDALADFCRTPQHAVVAIRYLEELERDDVVPSSANDPGFRAKAEFANWLAHPSELGRSPDRLEITDHRLLDWPPAGDRIPLWIVRYEIDSDSTQGDPQSDCGLVGSTTWCFFERLMDHWSTEDCYAVHCCWELGLYPDEADDSPEYSRLLTEYRDGLLENAVVTHILRIPRRVKYPRRVVALASASKEGESGYAVLDGPDSRWYSKADLPDGSYEEETLVMIHVGRKLLEFDGPPNR